MTLQQFAVRLTIPAVLASVVWAVPPAPAADSAVSYKLLATNNGLFAGGGEILR